MPLQMPTALTRSGLCHGRAPHASYIPLFRRSAVAAQGADANMSPEPSVIAAVLLFAIVGYVVLLEGGRTLLVALSIVRGRPQTAGRAQVRPLAPPRDEKSSGAARRLGF
eukprot:166731-Chlamydomonas_euryale.AAC.6